jgi:ribosomal protein L37E
MDVQCTRCGQVKEAHSVDKHMCIDCSHAENNRITYYRQHQGDWIAEAQEQGLAPWLQQPGETQWEYTIWTAYRDSYPGKKPTLASVALQLNTTYNVVKKVGQRWSFPTRMQLWVSEADRITMIQRKDEILAMNKEHIDMAVDLRDKLKRAIAGISPTELRPSDIASLAKLATELERKARIDTEHQDEMKRALVLDTVNPDLKKAQTKQDDLSEVVQILLKAGALQGVTGVGLKQTTELVVKTGDDKQ